MLLKFEIENYKSFKDRTVFSMIPDPNQTGLDYSILKEDAGDESYKCLSSAVIYGHNASGKTNLIEAMQVLKTIIQRGHIRNEEAKMPGLVFSFLELIPNNQLEEKKPVSFSIDFIFKKFLVSFSLSIDLGSFFDKNYKRKIINETLSINNYPVYCREDSKVTVSNLNFIEDYLLNKDKDTETQNLPQSILDNSLTNEELFLTNGFKNIVSQKLANLILEYFSDFFQVYYHADLLRFSPVYQDKIGGFSKEFAEAVKIFGIHSNELAYFKNEESQRPLLCSIKKNQYMIPAEGFESYGTIRFVNLFPMIGATLQDGAVLIVDEFDASIHPMAIMNIINIFHNDEVNVNHAQLIFNTHNPLFLNNNILRKDEIKFVERDVETGFSCHYSLSDFGTQVSTGRNEDDYMKNYFIGQYGAIWDLDLTDVFKSIVGKDNGTEEINQ